MGRRCPTWCGVVCRMRISRARPRVACAALSRAKKMAAPPLQARVEKLFGEALERAFPGVAAEPLVAATQNAKFGDYQCNNAMGLFRVLKAKEGFEDVKSPRNVAEKILQAMPENDMVASTSIAGPGFINATVSDAYLAAQVAQMLRDGVKSWAPPLPGGHQKVVVDFSSPNVAKEMHVGHLRSTIIGDTLCRCLEFCNAKVLRLNHVGDWGTQFGMLIEYMNDLQSDNKTDVEESVSDLQAFYKAAKVKFDEDEEFKKRAQLAVVSLQRGEVDSKEAWSRICDVSRKEFQKIYERLGVELEERGESFYNPYLADVVSELEERKIAEMSEGALCVFVPGVDVPLIVKKSDGGFNYASTDLAAIRHRVNEEGADWIIYVTDVGQQNHFKMVFKAAEMAGWIPPKGSEQEVRVDHVGFGLVLGEDGKRFRTRSGEVVRLVELLDEAKKRCYEQIKERRGDEFTEEEIVEASEAMGYGAVKYADLRNNRSTNYKFSFDAMLDLKGDTAVYLLYAHARIASIIRKSGKDVHALALEGGAIHLGHETERALALHIFRFPEAVVSALEDLLPNRLCEYLYDLSTKFTDFYGNCQVIGTPEEDSRLMLCEATAEIMRACFHLLGIRPLYRI